MPQRSKNGQKSFEPGDIVSLPGLQRGILAFAITGSHEHGKHADGFHYLTLRLVDKKSDTQKNQEGVIYHLSRKDLAEIKTVSGDHYALDHLRDLPRKFLRLEYGAHYHTFEDDAAQGIFFINYAKTYGTHFGKNALENGVRDLLKQQGIGHEARAEYHPVTNSKPPETVRESRKSLKGAVYDISVKDAYEQHFFEDDRVYEALKIAGVERISVARDMAQNNDPALIKAWRKAAGRRSDFAQAQDEIQGVHDEFIKHVDDGRADELERECDVRVKYPVLSR